MMEAVEKLETVRMVLKREAMTLVLFGRNEGGVEARALAPLNTTTVLDITKIDTMIVPIDLQNMIDKVKNQQTKMQLALTNATETALLLHAVESKDETMIIEELEELKKKVKEFKTTVNEFKEEVYNFQKTVGDSLGDMNQDINRRIRTVNTKAENALEAADTFNNKMENLVKAVYVSSSGGRKTKRKRKPKKRKPVTKKKSTKRKSTKRK